MPQRPIDLVIAEATSRGLEIERLPAESGPHTFDKRLLLIEGRRCQAIPSRSGHPNAEYPHAEYFPLYLPRTDWADFLVYVSLTENPPVFYIIPRLEMSKDTGRAPGSLEPYRHAWELLQQDLPSGSSEKSFEVLNWQLQPVTKSAKDAGLVVEYIDTKKHRDAGRWPPVIKRRVIIAGRKCAIFSAARLSQDPEKHQYSYAVFNVPEEKWSEFLLYVVNSADNSWGVFVIPRKHLTSRTSASLDHPELARYKNAWNLLTATRDSLAAIPPIKWTEPKMPPSPTKHAVLLQDTIRQAKSHGLLMDSAEGEVRSFRGVQSFLYVNKKRCQVIQAKVYSISKGDKTWRCVSMNPPKSGWAEFLIFYSMQFDENVGAKLYIIPRKMLARPTSRSLESKWLKKYEEAWHLLR
jgi:hypothetical protein